MKCANHGPLLAAIMIIAYLERELLVHAYVGVRVRARAQVDTPTDAASNEKRNGAVGSPTTGLY